MRKFTKSSTAVFTTLALGLLLALPAAAQTAQAAQNAQTPQAESDGQTYTVRTVSEADGSGNPDSQMVLTVVQKPGAENGEVIITWKEDPKAKKMGNGNTYHSTVEYDVETAKSRVVNIQ